MKYEPYNLVGLEKLLAWGYNLGWYGGDKNLFKITMQGGFERFSGRASETWEQRFIIETERITNGEGKVICPEIRIEGKRHETLNDLCERLLSSISSLDKPDKE